MLQPEERVLSTLDSDGRRRWLYPKLAPGAFWQRRRVVAYLLIAVYTLLPFIKIKGKPTILLDIGAREFTLFGFTFLPTDTVLLAIFMVTIFLFIFFATAIAGRVWCGWACPQTVYMEFVFRPIERFFTGVSGKGNKPTKQVAPWRIFAMYAVYVVISLHLANTFLAYFIGVEKMHAWIWTSAPWHHPSAFAVVALITGLMMFDFCYWREQLCIIGCPYGRFQSVLLDRSSYIIGYDESRGEPRGKGRDRQAKKLGHCVDCHLCVDVCPTGIDIRDGLQLECIGCAQCIDVCEDVMKKTNQPKGLIRYSSQKALEGEPTRLARPRTLIYFTAVVALSGVFLYALANKAAFDVNLLRGAGSPYQLSEEGEVQNSLLIRIVNRTEVSSQYYIEVVDPQEVRITAGATITELAPGQTTEQSLSFTAPREAFRMGKAELQLRILNDHDQSVEEQVSMLGPF